jgi:tight adherence protein B
MTALMAMAGGALIWAILFNQISNDRKKEQRVKTIKQNDGDRSSRLAAESRIAEAQKRRQSTQASLKELEEQTKAKNPNKRGIKDQMRQAGMTANMKTFIIYSIITAIVTSIIAFVLSGNLILTAAMLFIGGFGLPRWYVGRRRTKRMNAFLEEFPNAVDVITRGIKAGLPLNDTIGIIATEAKEPVRTEFKKILETQKMGVPMTEAIQKLYKNVPLTEANFFGIVIAIQQSAGGNLSEALGNLSTVLRDRKKMKAKIQSMSSEAKASAGIIGVLPPAVMILIYLSTPDYIMLLFTTTTGNLILIGALIWMGIGIMVMKQMINFDF